MERQQAADAPRALIEPPLCSIVIPTYNGRDLLARCLVSIERNRPDPSRHPIEIVVVDNGSSDGTSEWLSHEYPQVHVVRLDPNRGFCGAANAGLAAARGSFVQLLNDDTEVAAGWVEAGLAPFADPRVGSVAPLVLVRWDPSRVDSAGDAYAWYGWPMKRGHGQSAALWSARPIEEVFGASGSSAFYRAEALRRAGTLDMLLVSYYEDIDLAFRLRWSGYRCVYNPASVIYHDISATNDHRSPELQRRIARNAELVFWWNLPPLRLALAAVPHLAFIVAQAAWRAARGHLGPFLAGKVDAVRIWREVLNRRRVRSDLARAAIARPHFSLSAGSLGDVRHHLGRPGRRRARRPARGIMGDRRREASISQWGLAMSTVRKRKASFDYGYRDVHRKAPDGELVWKRLPLTLEDVLHPREGDVHMLGDPHTDDCTYFRVVLKSRYANQRSVAILSDCGIYWDLPGMRHHSPDLAVIFGVKRRKAWETFHVAREGVRPSLILEVTSPRTRVNDVRTKVVQYAKVGVPYYVIADQRKGNGRRRLELISYRLESGLYQKVPLVAGRAWLEPVKLWLGVAVNPETGADRVALIDPETNAEIGDYTAIMRQLQAEAAARAAAEARAAEAEARLRELEARLREAEAKLKRRRPPRP